MKNIHETFIENLIKNPVETYSRISKEIRNKNYLMTEFEELWPIVEKLFLEIQSDRIIEICKKDKGLALMRKLALQDLRHVSIPGVTVMPYTETLRAIAKVLEFFDICVRYEILENKKVNMEEFVLEEENPKEREYAYYHRYRYLYYYHWLLDKIPEVILIPTSMDFSAEDLMRFRCVPIFILGVATTPIYVDEFEQTPIEFFMHDMNHARRQYLANVEYFKKKNISTHEQRMASYQQSYEFSKKMLDAILIKQTDTDEEKSMKNLKRIIFFEIVHEDAEPFLPDVVSKSIQRKEGFVSTFEVPVVDPSTGLMNVSYTKETGISTLAYVRHKLQNGFYDKIGNEDSRIVAKEHRTTKMIARAAHELLLTIKSVPEEGVPLDMDGNVSYEYLLDRACSYGPEIFHKSTITDPDLEEKNKKIHKGIREVNIKNYFNKNKEEGEKMKKVIIQAQARTKELADVKITVDIILYDTKNTQTYVYLPKRSLPPYLERPCLPGGFLWEDETSRDCAERVLKQKVGISAKNVTQCFISDNPRRDPRSHIVSFVFKKELTSEEVSRLNKEDFYSIKELPETGFDHKEVIEQVFVSKA